jgi:hypothetical protein
MSYQKRSLDELLNTDEPRWPIVEGWISEAIRPVEVLSASASSGESLVAVQVTTRSPMGAVIFHTGGILVDHGWIRILGSGHERLPRSLPDWNYACGLPEMLEPPPWLLIGDDVLGGFFALNGGRFSVDGHTVWYFAPDTLEWEDMGYSYSQFLSWCFSGKVDNFYELFRWPEWESEVSKLGGSQVLQVAPPLFTAGDHIAQRSRRAVPIGEFFGLYVGRGLTRGCSGWGQ